jgi:hypothetical protein
MTRVANVPEDPLRRAPMSFDEWIRSFDVPDLDEKERLCEAAAVLEHMPVFQRVLSRLECRALMVIQRTKPSDTEEINRAKMLLDGVTSIRHEVRVMAEEAELKAKTSKDQ